MKKIIALLMVMAMVLSLAACGAKTEAPAATEAAPAAPEAIQVTEGNPYGGQLPAEDFYYVP